MPPFYEHRTALLQSRREKAAFSFPMHIHDRVEFIYVHSGVLRLNFVGVSYDICAGSFAVVFPYIVHGYDCGKSEVDYSIAIARPSDGGEFRNILGACTPVSPVIPAARLHSDVPRIMEELVNMDSEKLGVELAFTDQALLRSLIQLLLARSVPELSLSANTISFETNLVVRALSYVSDHFREEITLESVADALGTSRFSVSRLFSERLHTGFIRYINYLRIEYSKNLLSTTKLSVLEVALESGYDNLRTFNRVFKNACGTSPRGFRKELFPL